MQESKPDLHPVMKCLLPLVKSLQAAIGPESEVVLRDLRVPGMPIVAISGTVTGRQCGALPTELFSHWIQSRATDTDHINYLGRTTDGKYLRSSTLFIRGEGQELLGCLCINIDISHLRPVLQWLSAYCQATGVILFGEHLEQQNLDGTGMSDFGDIVRVTIDNVIHASSKGGRNMNRKERLEAVRRLDALGVFVVKNSKELVAARLGISKAALYKYLQTIRES